MTEGRRKPRDYQVRAAKAALDCFDEGTKSALLAMPTGTGKTMVAAMHALDVKERGGKTLFLAHREILLSQAHATLSDVGLECVVEMGTQSALQQEAIVGKADVVCATVQSLHERRLARFPKDYFKRIITDECHHASAPMHQSIYRHFSGAQHLGITATPDGSKRIGSVFEKKCFEYTLKDAVKEGWLSPIKVKRCHVEIDLRDISTTGGDLNAGDLAEKISGHIEELADAIATECGDRFGVGFTPDKGSAMAMAQALNAMGVPAKYVSGPGGRFGMPKAEKEAILRDFNSCRIQWLFCSELLIEGWDAPHVESVAILRPTLQRYRFSQMVGRGTRLCEELGKADCRVLDFDWKTDFHARDLCRVVDLCGGEDDAMTDAEKSYCRKKQEEKEANDEWIDPMEIVEEAKETFRKNEKLLIRLTGKKATYKSVEYDPVGVAKLIGCKMTNYDKSDWVAGKPSSQQLDYLRYLGVETNGKISKWGASKLIKHLKDRETAGLATPRQIDRLLSIGVDGDIARIMTKAEASDAIANCVA
jgi:superfamily II DNA or RNA helicase